LGDIRDLEFGLKSFLKGERWMRVWRFWRRLEALDGGGLAVVDGGWVGLKTAQRSKPRAYPSGADTGSLHAQEILKRW